ncbi:MAG: hypothetical protein ACYDDI_01325 [Candidatus Acidiferrales bacterium]
MAKTNKTPSPTSRKLSAAWLWAEDQKAAAQNSRPDQREILVSV